ncbi:MAG: DUF2652 domain-containing protein [Actinomycetota bacterium]|nr:DUF2652 domain-containing protein [Actinomycetota bacterium]
MPAPTARPRTTTAERGCLLIADISGYTTYLLGTELDHAHEILGDLIDTVLRRLQPVLRLSKLEGDAAFCYALEDDIEPSMLLDTIEQTYFAFRARLRDVQQATSCGCRACLLMPNLDLKFVVHHGIFARRTAGGQEELTGGDVVVVHRLLKNSVADSLDTHAYALFSEECVSALGIEPSVLGMHEHREMYDDVGQLTLYVEDLEARWRHEQERRRVYVVPGRATFEVEKVVPSPPPVVWEYVTSPQKRPLWQGVDRIDVVGRSGGRRGAGSVHHCVHGSDKILEEILDWRPFRYCTMRYRTPGVGPWVWTVELEPLEEGTRVRLRGDQLHGKQRLAWSLVRANMLDQLRAQQDRLAAVLAEHEPSAGDDA